MPMLSAPSSRRLVGGGVGGVCAEEGISNSARCRSLTQWQFYSQKPSKVERLDRTGLDYMRCGTSTGIPIASTAHAHQNEFSMCAATGSAETKMMLRPGLVPDVRPIFSSGRKE